MYQKLYIRFSNDIDSDIERGYSFYMGGDKMAGLCAWTTPFIIMGDDISGINGEDISLDDIISYAKKILQNTYGSYSDNTEVHVITGTYVGNGNDGVLLTDIEVVDTFYI